MNDISKTCKPLADRVIIKPHAAEEMTKGGIIIPESTREQPHRGFVRSVGPGRALDNGTILKPQVNQGDEVLYSKYAGVEIQIDGENCVIMRESDILAVL